jgi:ABC-type glycerol-3-phosphate transport system substrate-binding protein
MNQVNTNWMGVGSQSKHPELAWEFLAFANQANNHLAYLAEDVPGLPVRLSSLRTEWVKSQPWMMKALTIASQSGRATWTAKYFADLRDSINPELIKAFNGTIAPRVALENAAKAWQNILNR